MIPLRSLFSLALAAALLASCAGGGLPFAPAEPVTLKFAFVGQESDYQTLAAAFHEKYPHVTVELQALPFGRSGSASILLDKFTQVDVLRANAVFLSPGDIAKARPLDEFMAIDKSFDTSDFFPGLLEAMQVEQKQMALPAGVNPMVMFYEAARFQTAGVTPPSPDYTLEEFLAAATAVNNQDESAAGTDRFSAGFCTNPGSSDPLVFAYLFGGRTFDRIDRPTRATLNDPANVEALTWYARLWTEWNVAPPPRGGNPVYEYINKGWCGFWMNLYDTSLFYGANTTQMRMLPLPRARGAFSYALWDSYFLTATSQHPQEAWNWMSFLLSHQGAANRQIPPLRSQVSGSDYAQRVSADQLAVARGLPESIQFYNLAEVAAGGRLIGVLELFGRAASAVVEGQADAQTALEAAQKEGEKLFGGP